MESMEMDHSMMSSFDSSLKVGVVDVFADDAVYV